MTIAQDKAIADTILSQMGGPKIGVMIGVKSFDVIDNGLAMYWKAKAANKANIAKIQLNANDLYDITFERIWGEKHTLISEHQDVFNSNLVSLFENETSLALHL